MSRGRGKDWLKVNDTQSPPRILPSKRGENVKVERERETQRKMRQPGDYGKRRQNGD